MDDAHDRRDAGAAERQAFVRHELRTPLAVMRPALDMLLDGSAGFMDERQLGYVRMLDRNLGRLSAMITSVVDSGWLEMAALPVLEATVDPRELVETVVADVGASVRLCPRLALDVATDVPSMRGDRGQLGRAVRNVVVNACVYTRPSGHVRIAVRPALAGEAALIVVEDTGYGIDPDELPMVFDFGFQGRVGREREGRGLGVGLFVAREFVERHQGRIDVQSSPGEGTRVSLELPLRRGSGDRDG